MTKEAKHSEKRIYKIAAKTSLLYMVLAVIFIFNNLLLDILNIVLLVIMSWLVVLFFDKPQTVNGKL
jgi:hypothetical protein